MGYVLIFFRKARRHEDAEGATKAGSGSDKAYAEDYQRVFGEFIHHFPYFGMRSAEDAEDLAASFEATKSLYRSLFDEEYSYPSVRAGKCHKEGAKTCHKCNSRPGPDTIKCKKCKSSR